MESLVNLPRGRGDDSLHPIVDARPFDRYEYAHVTHRFTRAGSPAQIAPHRLTRCGNPTSPAQLSPLCTDDNKMITHHAYLLWADRSIRDQPAVSANHGRAYEARLDWRRPRRLASHALLDIDANPKTCRATQGGRIIAGYWRQLLIEPAMWPRNSQAAIPVEPNNTRSFP